VVLLRDRIHLEQKQYAPTTINLHLAAVRRVAFEAADSGLLSPELAAGIRRVKGVHRIDVRVGNWLTAEQGKQLLASMKRESLRGKRNYAMLAMLIGCGLRRGELLALSAESIQLREDHWVIADLMGKAGHVRTVPIPLWAAIDEWKDARGIKEELAFRSIRKQGRIRGRGMTAKVLWDSAGGGFTGRDREARSARPPPYLCKALPFSRRRIGSNPVSAWSRLDPDNRALSWV